MEYLLLGFLTSLSLILAIGAQNIFVIEQGLKKQYIFIVCLICSVSDGILIFLGLFLFHYIYSKIKTRNNTMDFNQSIKEILFKSVVFKTLGFTYLNPHVYSDTVFFLGNFSKNFLTFEKIKFGVGASLASFLFFFLIGYMAKYFSKYANNEKIWKYINYSIITFMSILVLYIFLNII